MTNEILSDDELDLVNGGDVVELYQIFGKLPESNESAFVRDFGPLAADFPASCIGKVAGPLNLLLKDEVAKILISFYGISSEMDVGFLSTGSFQYRNKYEYNGKAINHAEVLKML